MKPDTAQKQNDFQMDWMDRQVWLEGRNPVAKPDEKKKDDFDYLDFDYIIDPRTSLCFAKYKDLNPIRVPCEHLNNVL